MPGRVLKSSLDRGQRETNIFSVVVFLRLIPYVKSNASCNLFSLVLSWADERRRLTSWPLTTENPNKYARYSGWIEHLPGQKLIEIHIKILEFKPYLRKNNVEAESAVACNRKTGDGRRRPLLLLPIRPLSLFGLPRQHSIKLNSTYLYWWTCKKRQFFTPLRWFYPTNITRHANNCPTISIIYPTIKRDI